MHNRAVFSVVRRVAHAYGELGWPVQVLLVIGLAVVTTAFGVAVVVWLPADHFSRLPDPTAGWRRHRLLRWSGLVLKNLVGLIVLPLGIFMALPLVPGPGLVFILVGLSLLDFPGKRSLERRLLRLPAVHNFLNRVRRHFKRPPLVVDFSDRHSHPTRGPVTS